MIFKTFAIVMLLLIANSLRSINHKLDLYDARITNIEAATP